MARLKPADAPQRGSRTGTDGTAKASKAKAALKRKTRSGKQRNSPASIAQSPCTNLCDLGFFRSIDSRLPKLRCFKVPEFIQQIKDTYEEYPEAKIEALVRMKKRVVVCICENEGRNDFKLPHRKKEV